MKLQVNSLVSNSDLRCIILFYFAAYPRCDKPYWPRFEPEPSQIQTPNYSARYASRSIAERPRWTKRSVWTRKLFSKTHGPAVSASKWWCDGAIRFGCYPMQALRSASKIEQRLQVKGKKKGKKKNLTQIWKERSAEGSWEHDLTAAMLVIDAV